MRHQAAHQTIVPESLRANDSDEQDHTFTRTAELCTCVIYLNQKELQIRTLQMDMEGLTGPFCSSSQCGHMD